MVKDGDESHSTISPETNPSLIGNEGMSRYIQWLADWDETSALIKSQPGSEGSHGNLTPYPPQCQPPPQEIRPY